LFKVRLETLIDLNHELVKLSDRIDWGRFEEHFGKLYHAHAGRPGVPIRLLSGVQYLKHLHNLSDEQVVYRWRENPYWQYFCGCEYFEKKFPFDRSLLSRWRRKIGEEGVELLFQETLSVSFRAGVLELQELEELLADTTVQEKHITYPTDVKLYDRARRALVKCAKRAGLELRQTYTRVSKKALLLANRYSAARQLRRARKQEKKVKNYLGRVLREIKRAIEKSPFLASYFEEHLSFCERVYFMKERGEKIYSLHEPHVECIAKGKAHKRYEFGVKASVVTTARSGFILSSTVHHGRPHDGKTLIPSLAHASKMVGKVLTGMVSVDRGYNGHNVITHKVIHPNLKKKTPAIRKLIRQRSAIEATISHLKRCHRLGKNYLKGIIGDHINATMAAAAYNLSKLLPTLAAADSS
jgi:IS5 family transposase